ncbi:MAG: hypothetical protein KGI82_00385 [Betaproteobacteria bacterium]|nr:hypothetical protein [Betaproteobacteria bacterium]
MTLDDVLDLHDYWRDHPPVQWMVQAYLGIDPDKRKAKDAAASLPGATVGGELPPLLAAQMARK